MTVGKTLEKAETDLRAAVNKYNEAQEYRAAQQAQSLLMQVVATYTGLRDSGEGLLDVELSG